MILISFHFLYLIPFVLPFFFFCIFFFISLGATVNMDGGAVYFVCACIWLAVLNGEEVTVASFLLLIIIATVGSIGTAPVPSASLVLIITAYNTVFNTTGTPNGFGYILAIGKYRLSFVA